MSERHLLVFEVQNIGISSQLSPLQNNAVLGAPVATWLIGRIARACFCLCERTQLCMQVLTHLWVDLEFQWRNKQRRTHTHTHSHRSGKMGEKMLLLGGGVGGGSGGGREEMGWGVVREEITAGWNPLCNSLSVCRASSLPDCLHTWCSCWCSCLPLLHWAWERTQCQSHLSVLYTRVYLYPTYI